LKEHEEEQNLEEEACEEQEVCELAKLTALNQIYADKIRHQAAEFENYRNRTVKEMAQIHDNGVRDAVSALLPIIDNFERAIAAENNIDSGLYKGIVMIQTQMTAALEGLGIKKIAALGEKFDPNMHCAVSHIDDESLGENEIAAELACGYVYKDKVIRHSVVTVAN